MVSSTVVQSSHIVEGQDNVIKNIMSNQYLPNDVEWGLLNKQLIEYAKKSDWGLYRNVRLKMAEILRREINLKEALKTYLEICYFDLNGFSNRGGINDPEILKEFPPFDTTSVFIASGIVDRIRILIKKLNITIDNVKEIFLKHNQLIYESLKLPVKPENAWKKLEIELRAVMNKNK